MIIIDKTFRTQHGEIMRVRLTVTVEGYFEFFLDRNNTVILRCNGHDFVPDDLPVIPEHDESEQDLEDLKLAMMKFLKRSEGKANG